MQSAARWLFVLAVYGTLLMPVVLPAVAASAPRGARGRRLLVFAGGWIALCAVAGVVRLFTDDGYYAPDHVTFWAHSTDAARRAIALLLAATAAASAALLGFRAGWAPRMVTPVLVVVSGALLLAAAAGLAGGAGRPVTIGLIAGAVFAGALLSARARGGAAALFALIGGGLVTTLVMLTMEIGLGLH
jgi:hypothetical protein